MADLAVELIRNVAVLIALTFTYSLFRPSIQRLSTKVQPIVEGLLFGLFCIGSMLNPITVVPGVFIDGRSILLGISGAFGGWKSAATAAAVIVVVRLLVGGNSVVSGVGAAITSAAICAVFHWRIQGEIATYTHRHLLLMGLWISVTRSVWMLILPDGVGLAAFQTTLVLTIVLFPAGFFLIGTLLVREQQRLKMEAALKESEQRYRRLTEGAGDVIYRYRLGAESGFEYINPAASVLTGYTPEEHYADPDLGFKLVHPEDRMILEQALAGQPADDAVTLRWVRKDGQIIWTEQRNVLRLDDAGQPIALEGIVRDITQRKQAEEALKEREEQYRALFNQIEDAIFIHDAESNLLDVNQAACDRLGYRRDELLRMKTIDIDAPDYASKFGERLERQLATGKLLEIAGVHVTKDGRLIPVHVNSRAITYQGQLAVLAVARDVTELKRAEQQAIQLSVERSRVRMLTDFVRDISHDFRTPLTAIGTYAYLLFRNPDAEKRQQYFDGIGLQIKRMAYQVDRLLLMAQLDASATFDFEAVHLGAMLEELCDRFSPVALEKGVQLVSIFPQEQAIVRADKHKITQAVGELIENAIVFTPSDGIVTLGADVGGEGVVISVEDTGEGISPTDLPHIFKRLYRADAARSTGRGASGLGLSIAEKIIEGHQGKIEVETREGGGSQFRVFLPRLN